MRSPAARKSAPYARAALPAAGALLLAAGCHRLLDLDEPQCRNDGECLDRGFSAGTQCVAERCRPAEGPVVPEGPWSCLGRVELPQPRGATVPFELQLRDAGTNAPLAGVSARLCGRLDSTCATPTSAAVTSDAEGYAAFSVADNFDGYVEAQRPDYVNSLYYPPPSFFRQGGGRGPYVAIGTPATLESLAKLNGSTRDPALGDALLYVLDCQGRPAGGVRLDADRVEPNTKPFYLVGRFPDANAAATDATTGSGGFVNAPIGLVAFEAVVAATGQRVARVSLLVRPGQVTYAVLEPSP